ncbi:cdc42-interacting protein 4 homolog isoform X3 [Neocloeon triangulifer]|uniref:cdc42-interacting protein 4 homolog isoform X3 n=1 Tax=Neocloeon triangulifer TaxID=2078957 RepID=UPI00286EBCCB|nr:cdc42-interacting protein 4 homolog isoform X3 [Neocloeon triangulifer]
MPRHLFLSANKHTLNYGARAIEDRSSAASACGSEWSVESQLRRCCDCGTMSSQEILYRVFALRKPCDQHENLALHTHKGIEFLEKYGNFVRDRCAIETEYASKLRRLVKNYQPKKKDEEDYQYSACQAFKTMMNEVGDLAGQHELVAEDLTSTVLQELQLLVRNLKDDRKKHMAEETRLRSTLQTQLAALDRTKKAYEKAFKETEKALDEYQKADADLNLSRAVVEKARINMVAKNQQCEEAKKDYANQLEKTNELQHQHYSALIPEVLRQLQELDERRVRSIKGFMIKSVEVEKKTFPIMDKCLEGIVRAANNINEKEDTRLVIERYKSGFNPPEDFMFEDLQRGSDEHSGSMISNHSNSLPSMSRVDTIKGTISAGKNKKRAGLFTSLFGNNKSNYSNSETKEDYTDLPPVQRRKKLQLKLDEIALQINKETQTRDGLMKMKSVYEANSALGDPMSIEGQLNDSGHRLDKLRQEQQKFLAWLDEAEGKSHLNNPVSSTTSSPSSQRSNSMHRNLLNGSSNGKQRHSSSDESVSPSASSDGSRHKQPPNTLALGTSHSPESGLGSRTSLPDSERGDDLAGAECIDDDGDFADGPLTPLGTCKALYAFEASSEGSIPMYDGEELLLLEVDQGDGWTRVRRMNDLEEGFVPTSYIECSLYSTC